MCLLRLLLLCLRLVVEAFGAEAVVFGAEACFAVGLAYADTPRVSASTTAAMDPMMRFI